MPYYNGGQAVATDDILAIEAEARAPLEAERDLWKRDWGIKNDQWEKAIEARAEPRAAPLDVERLARALHATARRGHIGLLPDLTACTSADVHREDAEAIAREYAALEEPTE